MKTTFDPFRSVILAAALASLAACGGASAGADAAGPPLERVSADWLATLPDGATKKWFVDQCAGCHLLDERIFRVDGAPRTEADWAERIRAMIEMAGAETDFPILRPSLDPDSLAAWLARHAPSRPPEPGTALAARNDGFENPKNPVAPAARFSDGWEVVAFPLPDPSEVPHDVAVDSAGNVIVTGMGTHAMWVLDAGADAFRRVEIPVEYANPRAVEVDAAGDWWVLLGYPEMLARYRPAEGTWETWELGAYPHEIALDDAGRVWFNGHFSKDPEILGYLDPATGEIVTFEVPYPPMPDGGTNVPYGLRVAPDGRVWTTELFGGRLVGFDPRTKTFEAVEFPPGAGPRRHDVAPDGRIWVPEFGAGALAVHDPATGERKTFDVPIADALPYVARVDGEGRVWVGTAAGGAVGVFDPSDGTWELIRLPLEAPLARHLAIDPRSGAVWGSVSPFPARAPAVFRITPKRGT